MWRSVIALVLIPSLAPAQITAGTQAPTEDLATRPTPPPCYRAFTYYQRIRPGSDERAAFSFNLDPGAVLSHKSRGLAVIPMRLELKSDSVLSISDIEYPVGYSRSFQFRRGTLNVLGETSSIHFKVKAAKEATPGNHTIHGRLVFQQVGDNGLGHPEQIEVNLPVEIGWQDEMKVASDWPFSEPQKKSASDKREKWTLVAMSPLLIPLWMIASIVCLISGEDCRC